MKGHASFYLVGADSTTNVSAFSVGQGNAVIPAGRLLQLAGGDQLAQAGGLAHAHLRQRGRGRRHPASEQEGAAPLGPGGCFGGTELAHGANNTA